jgi:hypothetical protein
MNTFKKTGFSAIIVSLTAITAFAVPTTLQNGDFSIPDLNSWIVSGGVSDGNADGIPSTPDFGYAFFYPEDFYNDSSTSTLSQYFNVPGDAQLLSFDVNMIWSSEEGQHETDVFTAYLNGTPFFTISSDSNNGSFIGTVTYNIFGFQNQDVNLVFELISDNTDGVDTIVSLDNVGISIPAPGAVVLGLIGIGAVGLWRRFNRRV